MKARSTEKTKKNNINSARFKMLTQAVIEVDVNKFNQLNPTLEELYTKYDTKSYFVSWVLKNNHQPLLNAVYKIIAKSYMDNVVAGKINIAYRDAFNYTLIHWAISCKQNTALIELLVLLQCGIEVPSSRQKTPLMMACQQGNNGVAQILLENGANVNYFTDSGLTIMEMAAASQQVDSVELLKKYGASVNYVNANVDTALIKAVSSKNITSATFLLANGADVNALDARGVSCLHYAAKAGHEEMVGLLLRNGADSTKSDFQGLTAFDIAIIANKTSLTELMLNAGVDPRKSSQTTKKYLLSQVHNNHEAKAILNGFLLAYTTEEVTIAPSQLAAILGNKEMIALIQERCYSAAKNSSVVEQQPKHATQSKPAAYTDTDPRKRIRKESVKEISKVKEDETLLKKPTLLDQPSARPLFPATAVKVRTVNKPAAPRQHETVGQKDNSRIERPEDDRPRKKDKSDIVSYGHELEQPIDTIFDIFNASSDHNHQIIKLKNVDLGKNHYRSISTGEVIGNVLIEFVNNLDSFYNREAKSSLCEKILALINEFHHEITHDYDISVIIHRLGKLAECGIIGKHAKSETLLNFHLVYGLAIEKLLSQLNLTERLSITASNVLYGIGKLAEADCFEQTQCKVISVCETILTKLGTSDFQPQHTSMALCGIGKLANSRFHKNSPTKLKFDNTVILSKLARLNPTSQCINMTFTSLVQLAQEGCISAAPSEICKHIEALLATVSKSDKAKSMEIAAIFSSLGKLAEYGFLVEATESLGNQCQRIMSELFQQSHNALNMSSILNAVRKLSEAGVNLHAVTSDVKLISCLIKSFNEKIFSEKEVTLFSRGISSILTLSSDIATETNLKGLFSIVNKANLKSGNRSATFKKDTMINLIHTLSLILAKTKKPEEAIDLKALGNLIGDLLSYMQGKHLGEIMRKLLASTIENIKHIAELKPVLEHPYIQSMMMQHEDAPPPVVAEPEFAEPEPDVDIEPSMMTACKVKPPRHDIAPEAAVMYRTKRAADMEKLKEAVKPATLTHNEPVTRPGVIIAPVGVLENQFGVYAEKDIIVGGSGKKLLATYEGDYSDVLQPEQDESRYIFDHDQGGLFDATHTRNWTAYVNHSETYNVVPVSVMVDNKKEIHFYAVNDIRANEPLYVYYGEKYFSALKFAPLYLGPDDNWKSPVHIWHEQATHYCEETYRFNSATRKSLGLLSDGPYVVPTLFRAVMNGDVATVQKILESNDIPINLIPYAIDASNSSILPMQSQEKVTPYMLACHLGNPEIMNCFMTRYRNEIMKNNDLSLFIERSWKSGKTVLNYLLEGLASKEVKLSLFTKFMEIKKNLEKRKFTLHPYFSLLDIRNESLLSNCIRQGLPRVIELLLKDAHIKVELYAIMREEQGHANITTCIENGDLDTLEVLLKHAPDKKEMAKDINDKVINLSSIHTALLDPAREILNRYLKLKPASLIYASLFQRSGIGKKTAKNSEDLKFPPRKH